MMSKASKKVVKPVWGNCLVLPDDITETDEVFKRAKAAGIALAQQAENMEQRQQTEGTLLDFGGDAFSDWQRGPRQPGDNSPCDEDKIPRVGERILFNKYAGYMLPDGKHRIISDTDIIAVVHYEEDSNE